MGHDLAGVHFHLFQIIVQRAQHHVLESARL